MLRLFGFAHAGGAAAALGPLENRLRHDIDFVALDLPGRGLRRREALHTDRASLVRQLAGELAPSLDCEYALFGHSLGATLCFELAHALLALGCRAPRMLFVAAAEAPSSRPAEHAPRRETDSELEAELRRLGGTPAEFFEHPELMALCLPIVRADFELCNGASPAGLPPLPCPIHAYAGRQDRLSLAQLSPWRRETRHEFSLSWFEGDHFFVRSHAAALSTSMRLKLSQAGLLTPSVILESL